VSKPQKLRSVEQYGRRYVQEYLANAKDRHEAIMNDPMEALAFMYGKLFMRGRRDEVSIAFRDRTLAVIQRHKTLEQIDLDGLEDKLERNKVTNRYDRRMVREVISFARNELDAHGRNVFNWAADAIRAGGAAKAYDALTGIFAVGDKLATFYLRDVALVEGIEDSIQAEDYVYFQPVDTWVEQVALALEIVETADLGRIFTVKHKIISDCVATGVSPPLFNAGAWMVGAQAYRLLLERL
jgi:hypothetical protein